MTEFGIATAAITVERPLRISEHHSEGNAAQDQVAVVSWRAAVDL